MYRFFGEQPAYGLFNTIAFYFLILSSFFYYKTKKNSIGLWSKKIVRIVSRDNDTLSKVATFILVSVESLLLALALNLSTFNNVRFGDMVGTGANYFATLICAPLLWCLVSLIIFANPIKQIDIATLFAPSYLFFVKLACFFNGCCWGIEWEYGLYNYHYDHPGKQVPVQLIEAFWALAIFVFLLWYRKKAKKGTMYPMYLILYSATRFCSEFLRHEENVLGPLKTYHLLCIAGVVIGLVLYFVAVKYGDRMFKFIDNKHEEFDKKNYTTEIERHRESDRLAKEKARKREEKRKLKEREKKNKKIYSHSRSL